MLEFWFGSPDERGICNEAIQKRWWQKDAAFDEQVRTQFGDLHGAVVAGDHETWLGEARSLLAYVIVLDQFSRNMFRDDPRMYTNDLRAANATMRGVEAGFDQTLGLHERLFLYMPLMHAESVEHQERCVVLIEKLAQLETSLAQNVSYAERHRDIVVRFGRFPHRNDILQRESSQEEIDFLKEPGSSF